MDGRRIISLISDNNGCRSSVGLHGHRELHDFAKAESRRPGWIPEGRTICCAGAREGGWEDSFALLYLAIFNLLAETASSLQVLDMPLVEIDDEDMRVLFNLATCYHTLHLRVHVYLAIFNLLAETTSSLQVLDMPLVEIDDEDMRVLFNLATRYHTLHICESMKIDQTLPFLKATVRPQLQGWLHCRFHCQYHCSFTICIYIYSIK